MQLQAVSCGYAYENKLFKNENKLIKNMLMHMIM